MDDLFRKVTEFQISMTSHQTLNAVSDVVVHVQKWNPFNESPIIIYIETYIQIPVNPQEANTKKKHYIRYLPCHYD